MLSKGIESEFAKSRITGGDACWIGMDIGGTNSVFGIVDKSGKIIAQSSFPTQDYDEPEIYVKAALEVLNALIRKSGCEGKIKGLGIGAPSGNYNTGSIEQSANICWARHTSVPLVDMFKGKLDFPVFLTNDANAAAMGEMLFGAAQNMRNFIVITLGTGVGSGIVANGNLIYGNDGFAGELGHLVYDHTNGRPCGCGRSGCLETYCSATGVARTAREFLQAEDVESSLRTLQPEKITSLDVATAAGKGDRLAREVFEYTGHILGSACADFATFLSPEAIIFFGGLTKAGDLLMNPLKEAFEKNILSLYKGKIKILFSEVDDGNAAILGAAALAINNC